MERVVSDIVFDFNVKPRLSGQRGNAILVAASIYQACKYYALFQKTPFKNRCAVVTSYDPQARDISKEETGANTEADKEFIYNTYIELLKNVDAKPGQNETETYEDQVKKQFVDAPANMKLLVVVDKLLTGFDAPPCTYLYIDKRMQDHGLFQAICRTNRLDGDDKDFGYIVDYKNLFKNVEQALAVYTSELDRSTAGVDPDVLLKDRMRLGRERLDQALQQLDLLCEPVEPPKSELQHMHYFCGNTEIASDLKEREPRRVALYKATVALVRAYANIADELGTAGYAPADIGRIKGQLGHYVKLRDPPREYIERESHHVWGRRYLLRVIEKDAPVAIELTHRYLRLQIRPGMDSSRRAELLEQWYRTRIHQALPALLAKWEPILGVNINRVFVQRMKTRWGGCNPAARNIRLNTELAKKPPECLEYILVHELIHLREATHNQRFLQLMHEAMPNWRLCRDELNRLALRQELWEY